ncbi:Cyclin-dependent kinases regulatory subunit 2 [Perkinsus olseni]|uniref:Cyclin-dependent kinases regulatory subunit n=1 Tax=Perkinsus olseni TaxID=32597 RepID=A0A7J6LCA5_PEROL|nr:Cyclin-dependent kinases regulatory subunit 2 [Perkinsus olseni]
MILARGRFKPNFEVSGLLAEEQNSKNGIALMFSQPADAAMPTDAWRLYENRDEAQNGDGDKILHIHRKSCYLFGKDRRLTDCNDEAPLCFIPIDHPTCSRQHAVIQFRLVGDVTKPYLLDLGGKNGTFVNEKRVPAAKYYELREGDLIKFAHSSKSYVLLSAGYADDKYEYRHVILPKRIAKDMFRIFQAEAQMRGRPTAEPRLLTESEWRGLGVQQSRGWMHYENHRSALARYGFSRGECSSRMGLSEGMLLHYNVTLITIYYFLHFIPVKTGINSHALVLSMAERSDSPEPHILLFRRPLGTNPLTGQVDRVPGEMQPPPQASIVR